MSNHLIHKAGLFAGLILSLFDSCSSVNTEIDSGKTQTAILTVQVKQPETVGKQAVCLRGSETFSEDTIDDLHVLIYSSDGTLVGHSYGEGSSVSVSTRSGDNCTVYALVNTGDESFVSDNDLLEFDNLTDLVTPAVTTLAQITSNNNLLMSGFLDGISIQAGSSMLEESLVVSRLLARVRINLTGDGVTLEGYKIVDLPAKSYYTAHPNSSEELASDAVEGNDAVDTSTGSDWFGSGVVSLSGTSASMTYYQYENRRGGRQTVDSSTGDASDYTQKETYAPTRATYIELYGVANGTHLVFRLYPGGNAANYNIKRNCSYTYNVTLLASGVLVVSQVSIEAWTEIQGGESEI